MDRLHLVLLYLLMLWKMAKQKSQMAYIMAYTSISGSFDHYSDFPHSKNPESANKETLNSDVPGTYKFLLMQVNLCTSNYELFSIITPSLDCQATKVYKCRLLGLACESMRLRGETVPASCN